MEVEKLDAAYVFTDSLGWAAATRRHREHASSLNLNLHPYRIEDYRVEVGWTWRLRITPWVLAEALRGRKAFQAAHKHGHRNFMFVSQSSALLLPNRPGTKVVTYGDATWRQIASLSGYSMKYDWGTRAIERGGLKQLSRRTATMLCASQWYRNDLVTWFGMSEARSQVLQHCADPGKWVPREPGGNDRKLRVLFNGGDFVRKGGDILLKARALLGAEVEFVFVTKTPNVVPADCELYDTLKPDTDELVRVVQSCDVLALPTRGDANSIVAIEAAMCGIPSIVPNMSSLSELVTNDQTGTVLDDWEPERWAAAIHRYAADRSILAEQGAAARADSMAKRSTDVHMRLLHGFLAAAWT